MNNEQLLVALLEVLSQLQVEVYEARIVDSTKVEVIVEENFDTMFLNEVLAGEGFKVKITIQDESGFDFTLIECTL